VAHETNFGFNNCEICTAQGPLNWIIKILPLTRQLPITAQHHMGPCDLEDSDDAESAGRTTFEAWFSRQTVPSRWIEIPSTK